VEFLFGAEVASLLGDGSRVTGVGLADGSRIEADHVVAGAPVPGLDRREVAPHTATGRCTVLIAARGGPPPGTVHRTVVHAMEPAEELDALFGDDLVVSARPTLQVLRPDDPALRPDDGHEAITVTATVRTRGVDWSAPGLADSYADRLVEAAGFAVPGLADRVLWREVRTPADTAAQTGAPEGRVPGPALAGRGGGWLAAGNRGSTQGLHFVGGWAHPGGGLPHAGMSGALVAELIGT
jgi:phytoene dehydrogenase-like protein